MKTYENIGAGKVSASWTFPILTFSQCTLPLAC